MHRLLAVVALLSFTVTFSACAQTPDDVARLAEKGVSEQVILAFVDASTAAFELSVNDILRLKDAKVSEKVIVAMLRHKQTAAPQPKAREQAGEAPVLREEVARIVPRTPVARTEVPEKIVERERVVEVPVTRVVYRDYPAVVYADYAPSYVYPSAYSYGWGYSGNRWGCRSSGYSRYYGHYGSGRSSGHPYSGHQQQYNSSHGWSYRSGYTSRGSSGWNRSGYGHRR
jgi:hypothetical protein